MQIQPRESIPVVYLIGDTTDGTTYYAKATLRDSVTGATLSTATLIQSGRRFTGTLNAPADNTGRGRYIDITIGIYTDALFTTYASQYPEQVFNYVVQRRYSREELPFGGAGDVGGSDFDWKRLERLIDALGKAVLAAIPAAARETDLAPVLASLEAVLSGIRTLPGAADLSPILEGLKDSAGEHQKIMAAASEQLTAATAPIEDILERVESVRSMLKDPETFTGVVASLRADFGQVSDALEEHGNTIADQGDETRGHLSRLLDALSILSTGLQGPDFVRGRLSGKGEPKNYHADALKLLGTNKRS